MTESSASQPRLGAALRRAWVGYQRRLDEELAAAGFPDRHLLDGRVLRICARVTETTIAQIGRELDITRQGAGKLVTRLRDSGYVTLTASATNGREKTVRLTPRALDYLAAHRRAARAIERQMREQVGDEPLDALHDLVAALGGDEQPRMTTYLRRADAIDSLGDLTT